MRTAVILVALLTTVPVHAECAKFEPAITRLAGVLTTREYPGPPNYESFTSGDKIERQWILVLRAPLCVDGDSASDVNSASVSGVAEVQLVAGRNAGQLARLSGKDVEVSGSLFSAHDGHHRTPVLLSLQSARPNNTLERSRER